MISPISRPASRVSWGSNNSWNLPVPRIENDFVDLTDDNADSDMPATGDKRGRSGPTTLGCASAQAADRSNKRRKTDSGVKREKQVKNEESDIEELDLVAVDDDDELSKALQKQQEMAIKAQQKDNGDKPTKMSSLQCIICLERMTDMVVTSCGECPILDPRCNQPS